jgi:UDPglucose 6-dehydrogenase
MLSEIGIIGVGMVGRALLDCFARHTDVLTYDPKQGLHRHVWGDDRYPVSATVPLATMARECPVIFVCVPTPMHRDGRQDLSILTQVMEELNEFALGWPLVVIKSTVQPGATDQFVLSCPNLRVCFNPEFLREATAAADFRAQDRVVIGSHGPVPELVSLYHATHPAARQYMTTPRTAELVKYAANCFLAVKVSFANEFAQICAAQGVEYDELRRLLVTDRRIGESHLLVPGPDGKPGYGLTCFPKDLNAMIRSALDSGVAPTMLEAAWRKNLEVRPERDWESMVGRAVSEESA